SLLPLFILFPHPQPSRLYPLSLHDALPILAVGLGLLLRPRQHDVLVEITDLHVSTLASANPVDVISTDRHTVKPWFQGKLPFTLDRKSTRLNSSHRTISYAVFCLKKKNKND